MKSVGVPVDPEGNAAGETAVERIADEVGHAAGATRCREDDDRIIVRRHLSLRQGRVVERDDVAEGPRVRIGDDLVADLGARVAVQVGVIEDIRRGRWPARHGPLANDEDITGV